MIRKPIKVLVVDDSALVRKLLAEVLNSDPGLTVIGQAVDPLFAMEKMKKQMPDVITLDIEMPRMDGLEFLKKIMSEQPLPVVICSSLAVKNTTTAMAALKAGAIDIITKPEIGVKGFIEDSAIQIIDTVKAAAGARLKKRGGGGIKIEPKHSADIILAKSGKTLYETTEKVFAIGASTGGTQALRSVLQDMPANAPGLLIVQHMPEKFTTAFAESLNEISPMEVREAKKGDRLHNGLALVAPGGKHMLLKRSGAQYHVDIMEGPLVNRHRPSVDVMFRSVAKYAGVNVVACLMTGMGDDGARGLKEIRDAGGQTFAQDEASCVVFGMPQEALKLGAAQAIASLTEIPQVMLQVCACKGRKVG